MSSARWWRRSSGRPSSKAGVTARALGGGHVHVGTPRASRPANLRPDQRQILRALLDVYVHRIPDELADAETAKYRADADLDALAFAWAGGVEPGEPHYYRVQGRRLLAEYDNTQRGVNHVHTVWRDLESDFGGDVLGQHYAQHHDDHDR